MTSNFSEPAGTLLADESPAELRLLADILSGVSRECSQLGNEVAILGEQLSSGDNPAHCLANSAELQHFDRLMQSAHAHATLIEQLARLILAGGIHMEAILAHIENVPLPEARRRLKRTIGAPAEADPSAADEPEFWAASDED
jgi:hypothetical protein